MRDEQPIYISIEDDVTSVRERLDHVAARRVTLVVPAQTQLRSPVSWKLLRARARELGKEVVIVSTDPQIRSLAQAVNFKVAHSLEASPTGRTRGSRPGMSRPARVKTPPSPHGRTGRGDRGGPRSASASPSPGSSDLDSEQGQPWLSTTPPPRTQVPDFESKASTFDETTTGGIHDFPSNFNARSREEYAPEYDIPAYNLTPSIHPLTPQQIEEEPDLLFEDYTQAQDIRQAAREGAAERKAASKLPREVSRIDFPEQRERSNEQMQPFTPLPASSEDPFADMEEPPSSGSRRLREQFGSVSMTGHDTGIQPVQDIADMPTEVIGGEAFDIQGDQSGMKNSLDLLIQGQAETGRRVHGVPPRSSRGSAGRGAEGGVERRKELDIPRPDLGSEDDLPPIDQRPTMDVPQVQQVQQTPRPRASSRALPPLPEQESLRIPALVPPASRGRPTPVSAKPRTASRSTTPRLAPVAGRGERTPQRRAVAAPRSARRRNSSSYTMLAIVILVLLLIGALFFFIPSATVTVTLAARDYSSQVQLTALPPGQFKHEAGTVLMESLTHQFTRSGQGQATGKTTLNTGSAKGTVTITNNGQQPVKIPSGLLLATASNVQFTTLADAVVPGVGGAVNSVPVPVQAFQPGESGNVAMDTITVIPQPSLQQIADRSQLNPGDLKIQVTNPDKTSGGGANEVPAVAQQDLNAVTKSLHDALQSEITAWIQRQIGADDVHANPVQKDELVNPPRVGEPKEQGTFPATLNVLVTWSVVRGTNLQQGAVEQLNGSLAHDAKLNGFRINVDQQHPLVINRKQLKITPRPNSTALTLTFPANARAIVNLAPATVQDVVHGKSVADATAYLKTLPGVQNVSISTWPSFWGVPSWTGRIAVNLTPGTAPVPATPTPKPTK